MKKSLVIFFLLLLIISLGVNAFLFYKVSKNPTQNLAKNSVPTPDEFPYLSPRIFSQKQNDILINFVKLRTQLNDYVKNIQDPIGVYFEYLPSGVSININGQNEFVFVSLLKVPLVMAVYKNIEQGQTTLDTPLTINLTDRDKAFGTLWQEPVGTTITVRKAIYETLVNSDNTAKNLLGHTLTNDDILDVFDALDVPHDSKGNAPVVSAKNYSSVLRSLFLSSYLTKHDSNEILDILSQSHFDDKIAKPIPNNIKVAHKIGVYDDKLTPSTPIYSDCGIVYVPQRPYILCVMANTTDQNSQTYMSDISKMVYDYVKTANQ